MQAGKIIFEIEPGIAPLPVIRAVVGALQRWDPNVSFENSTLEYGRAYEPLNLKMIEFDTDDGQEILVSATGLQTKMVIEIRWSGNWRQLARSVHERPNPQNDVTDPQVEQIVESLIFLFGEPEHDALGRPILPPLIQALADAEALFGQLLYALEEATELRNQLASANVEIEWLKRHVEALTRGLVESQRLGNPRVAARIVASCGALILAVATGAAGGWMQAHTAPVPSVSVTVSPEIAAVAHDCANIARQLDPTVAVELPPTG